MRLAPRDSFDHQFDVYAARTFYDTIAASYDMRNSRNMIKTQQQVIMRIERLLARRRPLRVLDLGGGTGHTIATHFFNRDTVSWVYVDFSPAMVKLFQHNVRGTRLGERTTVILDDIGNLHRRPELDRTSFDAILLSFVLSSMPLLPDFTRLESLLKPRGQLIIADADPAYTDLKPHYAVPVGGHTVALRTNPINLQNLSATVTAAGFKKTQHDPLGDGTIGYSFVTVFEKPPPRRS